MFRSGPITYSKRQPFASGDLLVIVLLSLVIYGTVATAQRWTAAFQPSISIDLSIGALPAYAVYSLFRALIAYALSLTFTLVIGYWAAKSHAAEKIILPLLDIGQSIPVLGFLPGLVLGLISLFPHSNFGLELACIIMIFTGQVWNMAFSFYASIKAVPTQFYELSQNIRLSPLQRLINIELPYSASGLAWNSLMSMAGGWFFVTVCEAFTLNGMPFRLYGLGSYMAVAIEKGNAQAILAGFCAMIIMIVFMDFIIWRPVIAWTRKFRVDEHGEQVEDIPFIQMLFNESFIVRLVERTIRSWIQKLNFYESAPPMAGKRIIQRIERSILQVLKRYGTLLPSFSSVSLFFITFVMALFSFELILMLSPLTPTEILMIGKSTACTFLRILLALVVSTLWAVPFGVWVGLSPKRTRFFQPLIQIAASFPAPMLYPLALFVLSALHIQLGVGAGILMLLGVQWYVLFNVLAGATLISHELRDTFQLARVSRIHQWTNLYIPSIFPNLVTGWITATGGAWNASIIAEYIQYKGSTLKTTGLGALISEATASGNFPLLAGALVAMVVMVITLNRSVWKKIYALTERRYRFER